MNSTSNATGKANERFAFKPPVNNKPAPKFNFYKSFFVEMAAAGTAVTAYHPLRTISTHLSKGDKVVFSSLYKGFFGSVLGGHQLFLMGYFEKKLKHVFFQNHEEPSLVHRTAIGALAGLLTAPTVTPCDMWMMQRQLNQPRPAHVCTFYRGFFAVAYRQIGLGAGMFVLPQIVAEKLKQSFPENVEKHERSFKMGISLVAGGFTATVTQGFEVARMLMQSDAQRQKYKTTWSALKEVPKQMFTSRGFKIYLTRLSVIAVATVVMFNTREKFSECLFKEAT